MGSRYTVKDFRERSSRLALAVAGMLRRVTIDVTGKLWRLHGYEDHEGNLETFDDVEVFQGVGFASRPRAGEGEAVVGRIGGKSSHAVVLAARDLGVEPTIAPDETAIFNSLRVLLMKADGTIRLGKNATESVLKGNAFKSAIDTWKASISTAAAALVTAGTTWGGINPPTSAGNTAYAQAVNAYTLAIDNANISLASAIQSALSAVSKTE